MSDSPPLRDALFARNLSDGNLVVQASRLVAAYVVSLALLASTIIGGYVVLSEEMETQKYLSEANTHINAIDRTLNGSLSLLLDFRATVTASQANTDHLQDIKQHINMTIEELDTRSSLLAAILLRIEGSVHRENLAWNQSTDAEGRIVFLNRYVGWMRQLVNGKEGLGLEFFRSQVPISEVGAPHRSLSKGFRRTSEQVSEYIAQHSNRIDVLHRRIAYFVLSMLLLISLLIVLPLWQRLIREHKRLEMAHEKLHRVAYTDQETGLPNLDGFEQYILHKNIPAHTIHNHYLLLIRIKNLCEICNLIGSQRIMELHQAFSERVKASKIGKENWSRGSDTEYATVISQQMVNDSNVWVEQLFSELSRPIVISGILVRPLIAMAVSQLEEPETESISLLREHQANARMALPYFERTTLKLPAYKAKLTHELVRQNEMITAVTKGVENKEFLPFYQVKVNACTGELSSVEVLCRWSRSDGSIVGPQIFIPAAEKSGQIVPMTYQLLEQVVCDVESWSRKGYCVGTVAINVSVDVLHHKEFISKVSHAQKMLMVAGSDLEIEITENVVIDGSTGLVRQILRQLSMQGIRIAIDDFGTGYASLQTLIDLPFDVLKIDRSFVVSMTQAGVGSEVLSAMISLSSKLEKRSVVEGVEFEWQRSLLAKMGADELQGHLFHKPACAADLSMWLERTEDRWAVS